MAKVERVQPLKKGDRGARVLAWQRALVDTGEQVEPDGYFGANTEAATVRFQMAQSLHPDGVVGKQSYAAMGMLPVRTRDRYLAAIHAAGKGKWQPEPAMLEACVAERDMQLGVVLAMFVAQCGHETGNWKWIEEIWGPTPQQRKYEPVSKVAGQLGNVKTGDGKRYKGRGYIMLTGRGNHREFDQSAEGQQIPESLEKTPEAAAEPRIAMRTARWFWEKSGLSAVAQRGTSAAFEQVTRKINGGTTGLDDRVAKWERVQRALGIALV